MSPERVRCRHGFPSEICPSCQEKATPPHFNFGRSEPDGGTRPVGTPIVIHGQERVAVDPDRYAKALAVLEAAREQRHRPCEHAECLFRLHGDDAAHEHRCYICRAPWPCPVAAALAAFDEVEGAVNARLTELRQWAAREAVEDKPWAAKHIYSSDCPWCGQASHELALLLLDVVDAAAKWSEHLSSIEGVGRVAWNQLLDALEALGDAS